MPTGELNLNREFPGDPAGNFTQQIADAITRKFLDKIDVYIDYHSGTDRPTVDYVYWCNDEKLSRSFGSKVRYRPVDHVQRHHQGRDPRSSRHPGRGDRAWWQHRPAETLCRSRRCRRSQHAARVSGDRRRPSPTTQTSRRGGAALGRVVNPYTFEELELISNPIENGIMILSNLSRNVVEPGDYGYMIDDRTGATD